MMKSKNPEPGSILIGVVTKGNKGLHLLKDIQANLSRLGMRLTAVATTTPSAATLQYGKDQGLEVFENHLDLLSLKNLDLILELTGNKDLLLDLLNRKPAKLGLLDQKASSLLFHSGQLPDSLGEEDTEITLAKSFAATLLEASPDGVLVLDRDLRIINSNNSPLVTGGLDRESILGKFCHQVMNHLVKPCYESDAYCSVRESIKTGKPARRVLDMPCPDGSNQICQITAYPIFNRFNEIAQFVLTIRDMTQELSQRIIEQTEAIKKDLTRVVKEDRLASLGRLVASVCHEINNPITSIVTFTKLVLSYLEDKDIKTLPPELKRYLELSFREALRCGDIVKNLLSFARQDSIEATRLDIIEMVNTTLLLTSHHLHLANVASSVDMPPAPFTAWGDYGQIQQCLLNLVFNAIDAMPEGGSLAIRGGETETPDFIWLELTDNGQGIDPENLQRIFEPFFTTKTGGKGVGLGLGLAMVYGIINEHQGSIEVDSAPGRGTTFRIKLPKNPMEKK